MRELYNFPVFLPRRRKRTGRSISFVCTSRSNVVKRKSHRFKYVCGLNEEKACEAIHILKEML